MSPFFTIMSNGPYMHTSYITITKLFLIVFYLFVRPQEKIKGCVGRVGGMGHLFIFIKKNSKP
jgi:hypothetical protein